MEIVTRFENHAANIKDVTEKSEPLSLGLCSLGHVYSLSHDTWVQLDAHEG